MKTGDPQGPWVRIPPSPPFTTESPFTNFALEKYSRGRRGAPAKGVGRETGARVQIPPSPPEIAPHESAGLFLAEKEGFEPASQAPLAVLGAAIGGRSRLGLADRCAKKSSLHPPQAAVGFFARAFRRSGPNPGEQSEKPRTNVRGFFWRRRRDLNLLRRPSCGARRGHRRTQPPRPCRPLRQKILPASATGGGRIFCPRLSALGSKSRRIN